MTTTTINIRIDKETKLQAMAVAKEIGVDLSTAFHALIRRFIKEKTITFEPLVPNAKTAREITESLLDYKNGDYISFADTNTMREYFAKLDNGSTTVHESKKKNSKA